MSIEKYTTPAIVVESFEQGENDRVYKLFTRDFGLIMVSAKSIRKTESKLRMHIKPRGISLVTLVKGKEIWRLVGAEEKKFKNKFIHDVTEIIKRFIRGEGEHKSLYDRLIIFLEKSDSYDEQKSRLLLYYIFLVELGYADVKVIGAKDMKEYLSWSIDDLYTHLLLSYSLVRLHTQEVMKEMHL